MALLQVELEKGPKACEIGMDEMELPSTALVVAGELESCRCRWLNAA